MGFTVHQLLTLTLPFLQTWLPAESAFLKIPSALSSCTASTATLRRNQQNVSEKENIGWPEGGNTLSGVKLLLHVPDVHPINTCYIASEVSNFFPANVRFRSIKAASGCTSQENNVVLYCTLYWKGWIKVRPRNGKSIPVSHPKTATRSRSERAIDPSFNSSYWWSKIYLVLG